nr:MAG TPA: hypothetical protein [Caudoviricetes sp.]
MSYIPPPYSNFAISSTHVHSLRSCIYLWQFRHFNFIYMR